MIAFWRYGFRGVGTSAALGIFVATFALAAASHRWIERPARRTTDSPARVALRQWFLPGAVIAAACVLGVVTRGYGPRLLSRGYVDGLAALSPQADFSRRSCLWDRIPERRFEDPHCRIGDDEDPDGVLVLGDSNAAHFVPMLEVFARAAGFRFRNAEAHACPPPFDGLWRFALPSRQTDCESTVATTKSALRRSPVVVLGTVWSLYASDPGFLDALFSRVREFVAGGQHVILLAQIPPLPKSYDPRCRARALSFPGLRCPRQVESRLTRVVKPVNDRLREFAERTPGVGFFDANPELCPGGVCRAYAADGTEIYWDYAHLTVSGARRLGEDVLRTRGVPSPFDRVPQWLAESGVGGDRQGD